MQWLERIFDKVLSLFPAIVLLEPTYRGARITCGERYKIVGPGWYVIWPLIQSVIRMEVITQVVDLPPQTVRTKDGCEMVVSGSIRYHIMDVEKALFNVQDVDKALSTLALGVILEYIQTRTLDECGDIEAVKRELRKGVAEAASGWGLKIEQVYLTDFGRVRSFRLFGDNMRIGE
jgi:regulator of protease activity HflC (stomatin/prohibitin superfamily)